MERELRQASIQVVKGQSLVVPLIIDGLPDEIEALGRRWRRKPDFHLTAVAARVIEEASGATDDAWDRVVVVASGRRLGPITARNELRRVTHPEQPDLQTLIVMADCPGLDDLHHALSDALGATLLPTSGSRHAVLNPARPRDRHHQRRGARRKGPCAERRRAG